MFLIFLLDFHIDAHAKKMPSELRWLHQFLDNSRDLSYLRRHQCTAMSTPPVAVVAQLKSFYLWSDKYHTETMSFSTINLWLSNLQTQIHWDLFHPFSKDFSYLHPPQHPGFLQPTSDAQSRLGDFHQQATEEDNQWKHWRHQGGDKAHSGTILERDYGTKEIRTRLHVLAQLILFCLAPCFFKTKDSNTNIWSTADMLNDPSV